MAPDHDIAMQVHVALRLSYIQMDDEPAFGCFPTVCHAVFQLKPLWPYRGIFSTQIEKQNYTQSKAIHNKSTYLKVPYQP